MITTTITEKSQRIPQTMSCPVTLSTSSQVADSYQERLQRLSTCPTNHHTLFWCASSSLTHHLENSQEVTHPKITPQLAQLAMNFVRVGYRKRRCTFGDISNRSNPFKPYSGCYIQSRTKQQSLKLTTINKNQLNNKKQGRPDTETMSP